MYYYINIYQQLNSKVFLLKSIYLKNVCNACNAVTLFVKFASVTNVTALQRFFNTLTLQTSCWHYIF